MSGGPRLISVGCSWCHALVETADRAWPTCPECGHRADRARMFCDCSTCRHGGSVRILPLDLVDALVRLDVREIPPEAAAFLRDCGIELTDFGLRVRDPPGRSGRDGGGPGAA